MKSSHLRSDDGSELKLKEGVVLDSHGKRLTREPLHAKSFQSRGFKITSSGRLTWPLLFALGGLLVFIPILITAGFAIVTVAGVLFGVALLNQKLGRIFRSHR